MTKWLRKPGLSWGLFFLLAGAGGGLAQDSADPLEVHFIDVGQADAILVWCPDGEHALLIDSGDTRYPKSSANFKVYLDAEFEGRPRRIAVAVASHPHADHIGSMLWVLETFDVETYVDNGQKYDSATFGRLNEKRRQQVNAGQLIYVDGKEVRSTELEFCPNPRVRLRILVPWAVSCLTHTNDRSVVVHLAYGNTSFLFVGDAEAHAEEVMLNDLEADEREMLDVNVLKVGHHGSDTSSMADFVHTVGPDVAVVSSGAKDVGTNKGYKHPRLSTLQTYATWFRNLDRDKPADEQEHPPDGRVWAFNANKARWSRHRRRVGLWLTPKDGTVIVCSDGTSVTRDCPSNTN